MWVNPVEIGVAVGADIRDTLGSAVAGVRMTDDLRKMSAREAAEDYRRQRQHKDHGQDEFGAQVRAAFETWRERGRGQIAEMARAYAPSDEDAHALADAVLADATTEGLSDIDEPFGHRIISGLVDRVRAICADGGIPVREGVVVGVSPTTGLHAYQNEVMLTDVSIIDFALPFVMFCNQFATLLARTLPHEVTGEQVAVSFAPEQMSQSLEDSPERFQEWGRFLAKYAIDGWPLDLPRIDIDADRLGTRLQILFAMEFFAVAHEYGHHVLMHGVTASSDDHGDQLEMEHDADGFARMVSLVAGTNAEPANPFAASGGGAVLMLGALDLVRRTTHVLTTGNTQFPARETHPPTAERIKHLGTFDRFVPEDIRPQFGGMRRDLEAVVEAIWTRVEPMFLGMHHEGGVKLTAQEKGPLDWMSLC